MWVDWCKYITSIAVVTSIPKLTGQCRRNHVYNCVVNYPLFIVCNQQFLLIATLNCGLQAHNYQRLPPRSTVETSVTDFCEYVNTLKTPFHHFAGTKRIQNHMTFCLLRTKVSLLFPTSKTAQIITISISLASHGLAWKLGRLWYLMWYTPTRSHGQRTYAITKIKHADNISNVDSNPTNVYHLI